jgi:hypothetical protein
VFELSIEVQVEHYAKHAKNCKHIDEDAENCRGCKTLNS